MFDTITLINIDNAELTVCSEFLPEEISELAIEFLDNLCYKEYDPNENIKEIDSTLFIKPQIKIYDKICHQQRNIGFFSDTSIGYKYSNQLMKSQKMTNNLEIIINYVNDELNTNFNSILINSYFDDNYISAHSDDEKSLSSLLSIVAAISFGSSRTFRIRDKKSKKIVCDHITQDNELLLMKGNKFQKTYTHEVPKPKKNESKEIRYSMTFRCHTK
jgi:alkylated DNA repair dioxygenase AlkB